MPSTEVAEHWIGAVTTLGGAIGFWIVVWISAYIRKRGEARLDADRSPEVAGKAIGAAFPTIDRVTSQAISDSLQVLNKIYALLVDWKKHEEDVEAEHDAEAKAKRTFDDLAIQAAKRIEEVTAKAARELDERLRQAAPPRP